MKHGQNVAGHRTADTATSEFVQPDSAWQKIKSALWLEPYSAAPRCSDL
jgi:hypothetical protein